VLSWLGDRVDKGRVPFLWRLRREDGEGRVWGAILDRVLRRPLVSALAAGGVLVALAFPALQLHTANTGFDALPKSLKEVRDYNKVQAAFPGGAIPATVAIAGDASDPALKAAVEELRSKALATGKAIEPITVTVAPTGKALTSRSFSPSSWRSRSCSCSSRSGRS
jgi:uncharacterized membrane protein YdfJ with MMPL/SSD domain